MQRQRLQWLLCTLAALLIILLLVYLPEWPWAAYTLEGKFNKIQPGMTVGQVEALLGPASYPPQSCANDITTIRWNFPGQCLLRVWFDASGKVVNKDECEGSVRTKESTLGDFIKKLLQKIGL